MQLFKKLILVAGLAAFGFHAGAQKVIPPPFMQESWSQDYQPFRIVGNLYYVGTNDLAVYLITTPKGHILINTGLAESAAMIRSHIEKLGFKFSDIKILLATHAHYDHVGAMAEIKKMTGAKMMIQEKDASIVADGGNSDYALGGKGSTFAPVKADRLLHNNDTVSLDSMRIVLLHHPGHTKGASSFLFDVKDETRSYRVLIANMPSVLEETSFPSMPTYPEVGKDYAYTFDMMRKVKFDIWLASHASQFGLQEKHNPGDAYNPKVFIDQKGYDEAVEALHKKYLGRVGDN
jgi:metallo-beta-lactamase class B